MGQKVNSNSIRLSVNKHWSSKWFETKTNYASLLHEDLQMKSYLNTVLKNLKLLIGNIDIKRSRNNVYIHIPVYVKETNIQNNYKDSLKLALAKLTNSNIHLSFTSCNSYTESSQLLANYLVDQLEKRKSYRELFKRAIQDIRKDQNIKGIRINCSGRLDGAEIARTEWVKEGQVSLHTIKANIDYATASANTIYGICGIKVWICYK